MDANFIKQAEEKLQQAQQARGRIRAAQALRQPPDPDRMPGPESCGNPRKAQLPEKLQAPAPTLRHALIIARVVVL